MQTTLKANYRPAPGVQTFRQNTDWTLMSNDALKNALDVLALHDSPYEIEVLAEITRRVDRGLWLDIDKSPAAKTDELPGWLMLWPFCLLWAQRPRK